MKPNWPLLAALRFVLALIVAGSHIAFYIAPHDLLCRPFLIAGAFPAVLGFLMISGYSIAASIERNPDNFYERRFRRIYPIYLANLAFVCVLFAVFGPVLSAPYQTIVAPESIWSLISNAVMLQPTLAIPMPGNGMAWSLGVECVFYLFAPLLARAGVRMALPVLGASVLLYAASAKFYPITFASAVGWFPVCGLAWAWLLGWVLYFKPTQAVKYLTLALPLVLLHFRNDSIAPLSVVTMVPVTLALCEGDNFHLSQRMKAVALYGGELSYPLYLIHIPLITMAWMLWHVPFTAFYFVVALLGAMAVYHGVDKPIRLYSSRRKAPASAPLPHIGQATL